MDPELFCSDQELLDIVNSYCATNFQFAERMILVVAAQIGNATTKRFNDAAIVFRRWLVGSKDSEFRQSRRDLQCRNILFDGESFLIVHCATIHQD